MICLESQTLWSICKDNENYYIRQLSGNMHSETEAIYKLTKQEADNYSSQGASSLSEVVNYFSHLNNYLSCSKDREVDKEIHSKIHRCIFS